MTTATPDLTTTIVAVLPLCDLCHDEETYAAYDAAINYLGRSTWAFVCQAHFEKHGFGVGMGRGQRLITSL